ncbi:S49 family peptidase [Caldimonas manganoxidans]|uniref:S49 family peptidase n=1 Tax=Caldimonas manganoxidans TaxID=196015 RepID=UPI00037D4927|nr:S49 family peptidase [Caldimonas manganoxidans]
MLSHLASRIFGMPLLVHRAKLDVILAVLSERLGVCAPQADLALPTPRAAPASPPGIAVIPIHGTLVKRTIGLDAASGLTSYQDIGTMLDAALADPGVTGILLDVDSPGGEASGSFELARRVREAAALKPVWAVANDSAFSAAYAIAASAHRLVVTETGGVGSIGVIALHIDQSVKDANDGYRYTAITAGAHKNDFSPHEPLTDAAKAELQAEVDRLYDLFVGHVAAMRGLSESAVRATEAALYFGPNAVAAGLADAVGTLEATLADFSTYLSSRGRKAPPTRSLTRSGATHLQEDEMSLEETSEMIGVDQAAVLVAEARREVTQSAQAIAELCLIAGCPDKAAALIAEGKSEAEVRQLLIEAKASQSEAARIHSAILPDAGIEANLRPEASPVVAAVKKLIPKE